MPKDKLTDYDSTAANNLDVGGISVAEGMLPSGVNNAIREQMSHLADFAAGTSGVDVLKLQDDTDTNSIKLQAPSSVTTTTTFTLPDGDGASGQTMITDGAGTLSWAAPYGSRNLIINGAMQVAQRGTSHTLSAGTGSYTLDRVRSQSNGGGITVSQETNAISGIGTEKMCRYTGAASVTGVYYVYRIESKDVAQINGNSVTFSIYIENNSGASISPTIDYYHPTASDNFSGLTTIASSVALGTIANGSSARLKATTDLSGTTITNGLMFQVNFGSALTSGTIDFTGVQLEVGEQATPFEHRSYGDELARCQRYYEKSYDQGTAPLTNTDNGHYTGPGVQGQTSTGELNVYLHYRVTKRTAPTVTVIDRAENSGKVSRVDYGVALYNNQNGQADTIGDSGCRVTSASGSTASGLQFHFTIDAEL